jgi:hypothetical protein
MLAIGLWMDGMVVNALKLYIYPPGIEVQVTERGRGFQEPAGGNIDFSPVVPLKAKRLLQRLSAAAALEVVSWKQHHSFRLGIEHATVKSKREGRLVE